MTRYPLTKCAERGEPTHGPVTSGASLRSVLGSRCNVGGGVARSLDRSRYSRLLRLLDGAPDISQLITTFIRGGGRLSIGGHAFKRRHDGTRGHLRHLVGRRRRLRSVVTGRRRGGGILRRRRGLLDRRRVRLRQGVRTLGRQGRSLRSGIRALVAHGSRLMSIGSRLGGRGGSLGGVISRVHLQLTHSVSRLLHCRSDRLQGTVVHLFH